MLYTLSDPHVCEWRENLTCLCAHRRGDRTSCRFKQEGVWEGQPTCHQSGQYKRFWCRSPSKLLLWKWSNETEREQVRVGALLLWLASTATSHTVPHGLQFLLMNHCLMLNQASTSFTQQLLVWNRRQHHSISFNGCYSGRCFHVSRVNLTLAPTVFLVIICVTFRSKNN